MATANKRKPKHKTQKETYDDTLIQRANTHTHASDRTKEKKKIRKGQSTTNYAIGLRDTETRDDLKHGVVCVCVCVCVCSCLSETKKNNDACS